MPRRIIGNVAQLQADEQTTVQNAKDGYTDKLIKLVPAESVATYTFINGVIKAAGGINCVSDWIVFAIILIGTWLYLGRVADRAMGKLQKVVGVVAFAVFAYAQGTVFERTFPDQYSALLGAILVPLIVFLAPLLRNDRFDS